MPAPYVVDTGIWIRIGQHHPPDIFVRLWQHLDATIAASNLISPEEVLQELERGSDDLAATVGARVGLFLPLDDPQMAAVADVMQACPTLIDTESERNRADPFVVALARVRGGTVVTDERPRKAATAPFKIPDARAHYHIPCLDWFGFLREVGWRL